MLSAVIVTNVDASMLYNSVVLTIIAISQIYLVFAVISAQRQIIRERKLQSAKHKAQEAFLRQSSGEHAVFKNGIPE